MGVSDARANMTEVIAEVRLLGTPVVLTRREKPQAVLVSQEFYELALSDRRRVLALEAALRECSGERQPNAFLEVMLNKLAAMDDS